MTPTGVVTPGELAVLSVVVGPDLGPRLAVQLRPSVVLGDAEPTSEPMNGSIAGPASGLVPAPGPETAAPQPVAAGLSRSPWDPRR
jgi:hypothetical protein